MGSSVTGKPAWTILCSDSPSFADTLKIVKREEEVGMGRYVEEYEVICYL
jgi:hypothetical protein